MGLECLSSMRSEPNEQTPLIPLGKAEVIFHWNLGKGFCEIGVELWLKFYVFQ